MSEKISINRKENCKRRNIFSWWVEHFIVASLWISKEKGLRGMEYRKLQAFMTKLFSIWQEMKFIISEVFLWKYFKLFLYIKFWFSSKFLELTDWKTWMIWFIFQLRPEIKSLSAPLKMCSALWEVNQNITIVFVPFPQPCLNFSSLLFFVTLSWIIETFMTQRHY